MLDTLLTILCFSGFAYGAAQWLKIKASYSPLFSICFIGIFLYLFALSGHLRTGAVILLSFGGLLSIFVLIDVWKKITQENGGSAIKFLLFFIALISICFLLTINMSFTVIDDYVYWGIIGKYIYLHDHLPITGNPLDTRILAYTPGTALIHYFFNFLPEKYNSDISYFAQSFILISALFVVVKKEDLQKSLVRISVLIIFLTIFFGSIFTKLQVDYLLSIIAFALFWIWYNEDNIYKKLLTISMPVCFLFLVKEIGFAIGMAVLIVVLSDALVDSSIDKKDKIKILGIILLTIGALFGLKQLWASHATAMGFVEFHSAINLDSVRKTLNVFSDNQVQKGFVIFVKEVFFGPADRLNIPYGIWYAILIFLGLKIFGTLPDIKKSRFFAFSGLVFIFIVLYLFMLYCFQIIIFHVGKEVDYTLGFARYFNIMFSPVVFIVMSVFFQQIILKARLPGIKICTALGICVVLILSASRLEVYLHREKQDIEVEEISRQIYGKIDDGSHSIGIITGKFDGLANLQFLYYFLPNKVDYYARKFKDEKSVIEYLNLHDYVLLYYPDPLIYDWLAPCLEKDDTRAKVSFLRIKKNTLEKEITLERLIDAKGIFDE